MKDVKSQLCLCLSLVGEKKYKVQADKVVRADIGLDGTRIAWLRDQVVPRIVSLGENTRR